MSNPVSRIKNSGGNIDAEIESANIVQAIKPFSSLNSKIDNTCKNQFPLTEELNIEGVFHDGVFATSSAGSVSLIKESNYAVMEFPVGSIEGYILEFAYVHSYAAQAFIFADDSDNVLLDDGVGNDSVVQNVYAIVAVPKGATKLFVSLYPKSMHKHDDVKLQHVYSYKNYPDGLGTQFVATHPDRIFPGVYLSHESVQIGLPLGSLRKLSFISVAMKHIRKGTTIHLKNAVEYTDGICFALCDDKYVVKQRGVGKETQDGYYVSDVYLTPDFDAILFYSYTEVDNLYVHSSERGIPPYITFHESVDDFDYVTSALGIELEWDNTREGFYGYAGDKFNEYAGIKISKPIPTGALNSYYFSGYKWSGVPIVSILDENMQAIASYPPSPFENNVLNRSVTYVEGPFFMPVGASYFVLQDVSAAVTGAKSAPTVKWYYDAVKKTPGNHGELSNILFGKKYVACGDSFTEASNLGKDHYDDELKCYESYAWMIAKRNGMIYAPDAIGGSRMINVDDGARYPFSLDRYKHIPEDADYITLMFGLNESNFCEKDSTKGTIGSTDNTTVWGAWDTVLEWILTNRPKARVGIIIPDAWLSQSYAKTLIDIANYWGVPYLDLGGDPKVPLMNGGRRSGSGVTCSEKAAELRNRQHYQSYPDDAHPNYDGHVWRSTVIEDFIRSL